MKCAVFLLVAGLAFALPVCAADPVPVKSGQASFKLGSEPKSFTRVSGEFRQSYGFTMAMLNFSQDGKQGDEHLQVSLMAQKVGPVDLGQVGNGIAWFPQLGKGMMLSSSAKKKSKCRMTLTKLTATAVEGTAECSVLAEMSQGEGRTTLSEVKFSASIE